MMYSSASCSSEFSKGAADGSYMCIMKEPPHSASHVLQVTADSWSLCSAEMPDPTPTQSTAVSLLTTECLA